MHLKLICCKILQRELARIISESENTVDFTMLRQDYHQTPEVLRTLLQEEIDAIDNNSGKYTNDLTLKDIDAILLGYGLCSNAILGLCSKKYKIVVPKAHDCTTLIMGSKEKYKEYFDENGGTYFYTRSWLELGISEEEQRIEKLRKEYMEKFGDEDIVEYLLSMERDMIKNYNCAAYVSWPDTPDRYEKEVISISEKKGWNYKHIQGTDSLLRDFVDGNWDEERFLIVSPGEQIAPSYDDGILKVKKVD